MEVLIILGCLIVLAIYILAGVEFGEIAEMKGHEKGKYIAWCIFTSFIGYCMVIALPDRRGTAAPAVSRDELPEL